MRLASVALACTRGFSDLISPHTLSSPQVFLIGDAAGLSRRRPTLTHACIASTPTKSANLPPVRCNARESRELIRWLATVGVNGRPIGFATCLSVVRRPSDCR